LRFGDHVMKIIVFVSVSGFALFGQFQVTEWHPQNLCAILLGENWGCKSIFCQGLCSGSFGVVRSFGRSVTVFFGGDVSRLLIHASHCHGGVAGWWA